MVTICSPDAARMANSRWLRRRASRLDMGDDVGSPRRFPLAHTQVELRFLYFILYNKELFAAKNVAIPQTWDEMAEAAKRLADPSKQVYGHVGRGVKNANVVLWSSYLLGTAQRDMIDANRQLSPTRPTRSGPARSTGSACATRRRPARSASTGTSARRASCRARVGMWVDGVGFAALLEDPRRGRASPARSAHGVMPRGTGAQHHCAMFGGGVAIAEARRSRGPACSTPSGRSASRTSCKWLASGGGEAGPQEPLLAERGGDRGQPLPAAELFQTLEASAKIGRAGLPEIVPVTEFRDGWAAR